jgi:Peptidase family S41
LLPYSRADGANDAKRISNLEVQGRARYEAFDVYFPLRFPRPAAQPFLLELRSAPGEPVQSLAFPGMAADARRWTDGAPRGTTNPWSFRFLAPGVAYLGMPTWAMYNSKFAWEEYLDERFRELVAAGTGDLVIDLRANEGGSNVGDRLLAHLVDAPLPRLPIERRTRYRQAPADLVPYLDTWDPGFRDWGEAAVDLGNGFYRLSRAADGGHAIAPVAPRYAGRVWVLVGPVNSSATFEFISAVKRHGLATLIGQPSGGNQRGITGGAYFFLRLPRTGIEVDVPLIGQFPLADPPPPDAGILPDVAVRPSLEDVARGRDTELDAVLELIAASRRG